MAQTLDQLKQKYQAAIGEAQRAGHLENVNMDGDKLYIRAEVANEDLKNQIWTAIKSVDPEYKDLMADIRVNSTLQAPATAAAGAAQGGQTGGRTYHVKPGDTLSGIAQREYGSANQYQRIFEANRDKLRDPDHVPAGIDLVIPE